MADLIISEVSRVGSGGWWVSLNSGANEVTYNPVFEEVSGLIRML